MPKTKVFKKPKKLKMSKRSEKALDESIEHWYRVRNENELAHRDNCSLCEEYFWEEEDYECENCPVSIKTGTSCCEETPYDEYDYNYDKVSEPKRKRFAQAEIDFLQSCYY